MGQMAHDEEFVCKFKLGWVFGLILLDTWSHSEQNLFYQSFGPICYSLKVGLNVLGLMGQLIYMPVKLVKELGEASLSVRISQVFREAKVAADWLTNVERTSREDQI